MKKIFGWILAGSVVTSVALNLYYLFSQSIRLDEAQSIWVSTKSVMEILKIDGQDVQTPLYTLLLHFWMQVLGTDIVVARLMSLIFFLLTLPFLFRLLREVINREVALLGVALFALSPFVLWYSQEARTYTLITMLAAANNLFFLRMLKTRGRSNNLFYLISSLLGLYSHYFFVFLLLSQAIYVLAFILKRVSKKRKPATLHWHFFWGYVVTGMTILMLFLPWVAFVYRLGLAANTQPMIPTATSYNLIQIYLNFIFGFQNQNLQSLAVSVWPLFLMVLFFIFTRKFAVKLLHIDYFVTVSFLPVVIVYLVSFYKPIFLPRYLIFVTPTLFVLLAWLLVNFGKKVMSGLSTGMVMAMMVSMNFQSKSTITLVKEDYRNVVNRVEKEITPQDIVATSAPFTTYPLEYYYKGLARIDTIPHWNRYVVGSISKFTPELLQKQIEDYSKTYNRIFLILSYDQGYQGKIVDYMDHHYQLLENEVFPADINLRVYQLRYDTQLQLGSKI